MDYYIHDAIEGDTIRGLLSFEKIFIMFRSLYLKYEQNHGVEFEPGSYVIKEIFVCGFLLKKLVF